MLSEENPLHKLTPEQLADIAPFIAVVQNWRRWKKTHDRVAAKHVCCGVTQLLFDSLDTLEQEIIADLSGERAP